MVRPGAARFEIAHYRASWRGTFEFLRNERVYYEIFTWTKLRREQRGMVYRLIFTMTTFDRSLQGAVCRIDSKR